MAKLVFCEDEEKIQKLISFILRSSPYEIYLASDGLEGLAIIERERPNLIFADVSMPHCDGFKMADRLKAKPELARIPLVFMTAFAQASDIEEGYRHGAIGYLVKPFGPIDLREQIEVFLGSAA